MYLQLIYTNPQTARLSCNPLIKQPGWSPPLPRLISLSRLKRMGTNKEHKQGSDSQLFKGLGDSSGDQQLSPPLAGALPQPTSLLSGTCKNSSVFSRSSHSSCGTGTLWETGKTQQRRDIKTVRWGTVWLQSETSRSGHAAQERGRRRSKCGE